MKFSLFFFQRIIIEMPSHYTNHFLCSQVRACMLPFSTQNEANYIFIIKECCAFKLTAALFARCGS
jgi:hypothetical protein